MGRKCSARLTVSKETKELLKEVKEEYLNHHPEMEGARLTENHLVYQTFAYYIGLKR